LPIIDISKIISSGTANYTSFVPVRRNSHTTDL